MQHINDLEEDLQKTVLLALHSPSSSLPLLSDYNKLFLSFSGQVLQERPEGIKESRY